MSVSEAHKRANRKYQSEKVDDLRIRIPKGQREVVRSYAEKHGLSINSFVWQAICAAMQEDADSD